jgi:uncharacterized protein
MQSGETFTAFLGQDLLASGSLETVLRRVKAKFDENISLLPFIFEDRTGRQLDVDLRGSVTEVLARALPVKAANGPGRPKLGVVSREVSLLPRHWSWLEQQSNGASAALRRLVEDAMQRDLDRQQVSLAKDAAFRFMSAMAGNLPGYEEVVRALYVENDGNFHKQMENWPVDIRMHILGLTQNLFALHK